LIPERRRELNEVTGQKNEATSKGESDAQPNIRRICFLSFALMFGFSTPRRMQAQDNSVPSTIASIDPYLMDRDAEIAMARSSVGRAQRRSGSFYWN